MNTLTLTNTQHTRTALYCYGSPILDIKNENQNLRRRIQ
jgi:hypothetical protein